MSPPPPRDVTTHTMEADYNFYEFVWHHSVLSLFIPTRRKCLKFRRANTERYDIWFWWLNSENPLCSSHTNSTRAFSFLQLWTAFAHSSRSINQSINSETLCYFSRKNTMRQFISLEHRDVSFSCIASHKWTFRADVSTVSCSFQCDTLVLIFVLIIYLAVCMCEGINWSTRALFQKDYLYELLFVIAFSVRTNTKNRWPLFRSLSLRHSNILVNLLTSK